MSRLAICIILFECVLLGRYVCVYMYVCFQYTSADHWPFFLQSYKMATVHMHTIILAVFGLRGRTSFHHLQERKIYKNSVSSKTGIV